MFKPVLPSTARFNSDASCKLIDIYESAMKSKIQAECARPSSCTFAPSAMRCQRKSWFRLRGVQPDFINEPDLAMDHIATVGTALHKNIQKHLSMTLGNDWIDVEQYLKDNPIPYKYTVEQKDYETLIEIADPPIKFACDGIIRVNGIIYLLEIKSAENDTWANLKEIKPYHIEQITTYATMLHISHVLSLYVDRLYGRVKSFEHTVRDSDMEAELKSMATVQQMARYNIAPNKLPTGDYMCSNCEYKLKCKEW